MARGRIPIKDAERISEARDCPVVIIFSLEGDCSTFGVTTYGKTKALCRHAASLGEQFAQAILNGSVAPVAQEPTHLPNEPTEWIGSKQPPARRGGQKGLRHGDEN